MNRIAGLGRTFRCLSNPAAGSIQKADIDTKLAEYKKPENWKIFYKADGEYETTVKSFYKYRNALGKAVKFGFFITAVRSFLYMSTELDDFLYTTRDLEFFALFGGANVLLYWYFYCGIPVTEMHMSKDLSKVRIGTMIDSHGSIKHTFVKRTDLVAVRFDRLQAMQPIIVRLDNRPVLIGHYPITSKCEITNRLAFELAFGPAAYNSFQFFQRRERIGLESVFERRKRQLGKRATEEAKKFGQPRGATLRSISRYQSYEDSQTDLRYRRHSLTTQFFRISRAEEFAW